MTPPDPLVVPGAPGVPGAETPGQPAMCNCPYFDPVVACSACGMPMDDCDAKHDQLGNWCCFGCSHAAVLGVPHAVHPPLAGCPVAHTEKGERR